MLKFAPFSVICPALSPDRSNFRSTVSGWPCTRMWPASLRLLACRKSACMVFTSDATVGLDSEDPVVPDPHPASNRPTAMAARFAHAIIHETVGRLRATGMGLPPYHDRHRSSILIETSNNGVSELRQLVHDEPACAAQPSSASTVAAAFSPDLTAPSIYPHHSGEVSAPAQWIGPAGVVSACPYLVHTF